MSDRESIIPGLSTQDYLHTCLVILLIAVLPTLVFCLGRYLN
jgi:hypothetical protein